MPEGAHAVDQKVVHGNQLGRVLIRRRVDCLVDSTFLHSQDFTAFVHYRMQGNHTLVQGVAAAGNVAPVFQTVDQGADTAGTQVHQMSQLTCRQCIEFHDVFQCFEIIQGDIRFFG